MKPSVQTQVLRGWRNSGLYSIRSMERLQRAPRHKFPMALLMLLMSAEKARSMNVKIRAMNSVNGHAGVDPSIMGYGPVPASQKALKKADLDIADIECVELNGLQLNLCP